MATLQVARARHAQTLAQRPIVQRRTITATPPRRNDAGGSNYRTPPIRFGRFLAIGTAFCVAGLIWTYMPGSYHTEIGMEMRDKALDEFQEKEYKEGYRGEHETEAQRKDELVYRANHRGQAKGGDVR